MTLFARYPFATFFVLAVLIATAVVVRGMLVMSTDMDAASAFVNLGGDIRNAGGYINIPWIWHFAVLSPPLLGIFVFAAAPSISALVVASLSGRLSQLLSLLRPWRNVGAGRAMTVYAGILAVYALGIGLLLGLGMRQGGEQQVTEALNAVGATGFLLVPALLLALVLDEGGSLEELGWRGFVMQLFSERFAPTIAAVLLGVAWWAWHLPREAGSILTGVDPLPFLWGQAIFLMLCIALSIVIAFCWFRVGGSVWPGVLIHGGTNVWSKAFGHFGHADLTAALSKIHPLLGSFDLRTIIVIALAVVVLLIAGPALGRDTAHAGDAHQ